MFISPSSASDRVPAFRLPQRGTAELSPSDFVAPTRTLPAEFTSVSECFLGWSYDELLSEAQRLRSNAYAAEGIFRQCQGRWAKCACAQRAYSAHTAV